MDIPTFANKMNVDEDRLVSWEDGVESITFVKAMEFAKKTHVPFGYLFLSEPPVEQLPIPDLRTVDGKGVGKPSAELFDLIKLMLDRQEWYRDYLLSNLARPVICVGRATLQDSVDDVVRDIKQILDVPTYPTRGKWDDYYRELVGKIERIGVSVMRQPYIGHHTRPLNVDEFRGFALCDDYAPMIFINHADAPGPRLFTLIHELCHIWLNKPGISDGDPSNNRDEEKFCNAVAVHVSDESEHSFRFNPITHFGLNRSPVSVLSDHF
ncbi:ImmA/IrrE family metallo-endopeptidase [Idiomarina fontislapidosi]|nr:ImmA/IrrE family metallo-endopeptidase [Idiomarina fontislapidosi]